jgi:histone acetyltransferase
MKDEKSQIISLNDKPQTSQQPNSASSLLVCETGLGFSARDKNIKTEEDKGQIEFHVIKNDGNLRNLKLLTDLKNIISKQLPKMPKEYIVRLVFDKKHESMIIMKNNVEKVIGGVCYRPNYEQGFIEIAFLAISSLEQVKVNFLKTHLI